MTFAFSWEIFWSVLSAIVASHVFYDVLMLVVAAIGKLWEG
jgi:hypothetical protein